MRAQLLFQKKRHERYATTLMEILELKGLRMTSALPAHKPFDFRAKEQDTESVDGMSNSTLQMV
jgi:hypothetical protein